MADATLRVGGKIFRGWSQIRVTRSLEAVAGGFSLRAIDSDPVPIPNGTPVRLDLAGTPVLSGFTDRVSYELSPGSRSIRVTGRDRTADLVDCSVLDEAADIRDLDAHEIATRLARSFGIEVMLGLGVDPGEPFPIFKLQVGETAWDAIERACKLRGLLAVPTSDGRLRLTRPGNWPAVVDLVEGVNVEQASLRSDHTQRFHRYVCQGQSNGGDNLNGEEASHIEGSAEDAEISRWRPLLILAEGVVQPGTAQMRAEWEASVRAARSDRATVKVPGWEQEPGMLWGFNLMVRAKIPSIALEGRLLVVGVTYQKDPRSGTSTTLELARPDAFLLQDPATEAARVNPYAKYFEEE